MKPYINGLVSVIMPVYNGYDYLNISLKSVMSQTYKKIELIIIDDCSSDNSAEIITQYAKEYQNVIVLKNAINQGCSKSRNLGILASKGEYIAFIDQDDYWYPTKIERQIANILESNCAMTCCDVEYSYKNLYVYSKSDIPKNFHLQNKKRQIEILLCCNFLDSFSCVVIARKCIESIGLLDDNCYGSDDYEYWLRLIKDHNISCLKDILVKKTEHENNYSWKNIEKLHEDKMYILNKYRHQYGLKNINHIYYKHFQNIGIILLIQKKKKKSRTFFIQSSHNGSIMVNGFFIILSLFPDLVCRKVLKWCVYLVSLVKGRVSRWYVYVKE